MPENNPSLISMRERKEIEGETTHLYLKDRLTLEVLLDIRELLKKEEKGKPGRPKKAKP